MGAHSPQQRSGTEQVVGSVPFPAHVELLRLFLTHRKEIVAGIENLLIAHRSAIPQDPALLAQQLEDCFFGLPAVTPAQTQLRGQLEHAYRTLGFMPRRLEGLHNDLIHPAEMLLRGLHFWQQTGWPVRNRRTHYAHTLFNVALLRSLEFLSLRLWDDTGDEPQNPTARLAQLQTLLDDLWSTSPPDQPKLVRDARWLIPLAQSLPTEELAPYLEVARLVLETLPPADALEIQKAHVRMLGGHLTSQIRHYCTRDGVSIEEHSVVLRTRTSNALDFALLIQGLVALLQAYEGAMQAGDERVRLDLAGAIFQAISPDPQLFLNRVDLLAAHSTMELAFTTVDQHGHAALSEGHVTSSSLGEHHMRLLHEYRALIHRLAGPLRDDLPRFQPHAGGCSSYGIVFGTPSVLTELMALKTVQRDAETRFSLEDVFSDDVFSDADLFSNRASAAKLAWVEGWRKLPHIPIDVQRQYDYPQHFAEEIYQRIQREFACHNDASFKTGRLYLVSDDVSGGTFPEGILNDAADSDLAVIPELAAHYVASTDPQLIAAHQAEPYDDAQMSRGRLEGHFLVSWETPGGWAALRKALLEEVLGVGHNARVTGLPRAAAQRLRLLCGDLVRP